MKTSQEGADTPDHTNERVWQAEVISAGLLKSWQMVSNISKANQLTSMFAVYKISFVFTLSSARATYLRCSGVYSTSQLCEFVDPTLQKVEL